MQWSFACHNSGADRLKKHLAFQGDEQRRFLSVFPALYKLVDVHGSHDLEDYQELYRHLKGPPILAVLTSRGLGSWLSHPDYNDVKYGNSKNIAKIGHAAPNNKATKRTSDESYTNACYECVCIKSLNMVVSFMVMKIKDELSRVDPNNAQAIFGQLLLLDEQLVELIDPVKEKRFIVFHDGYNYFETKYGLSATGALRISPDVSLGVKNVEEIREILESKDVGCTFTEPQFNPKRIESLADGLNVNIGLFDPLGAELDDGQLMRNMAFSFQTCLSVQN